MIIYARRPELATCCSPVPGTPLGGSGSPIRPQKVLVYYFKVFKVPLICTYIVHSAVKINILQVKPFFKSCIFESKSGTKSLVRQ